MDINFELYKVFYHAACEENFSAAGDKLFISQSAVSQNIKNLELKMGIQLFNRHGRRLTLTQEGEWLYQQVHQAYNLFRAAELKMKEIHDLEGGEVRIGASDTVCRYFLLPYLQRYNREFPKVKIRLINRTSSQIRKILEEGKIDFGVVTLLPQEQGAHILELTTVQDIFVASTENFNYLSNKILHIKDLRNYPLLLLEGASTSRRNFDQYLSKQQIQLIPEMELESMDLLVEFARIGLGISYVLKESAELAIKSGELYSITIAEALPKRKLGIITDPQIHLPRAAEKFISLVQNK